MMMSTDERTHSGTPEMTHRWMEHASGGTDRLRRAKIVATLGPATSTPEMFRKLVQAGLDVARLNFSHGSHEQKAELIRMVRQVAKEEGKPICILADLQGPKIRTGKLRDHKPVQLVAGERLRITPREIEGTKELVGTTFTTLAENLEPGSRILLSDGLIELRVERVDGEDVVCEIVNGGTLGENKGINLPGIAVNVPSLTEKDEEDLIFAIGQDVDTVAVSFVRTADDVRHVKSRLAALKSDAWVIAKLESRRRSSTWTRSAKWRTASWWRAATWGWRCRRRRCRRSRSTSSSGRRSFGSR